MPRKCVATSPADSGSAAEARPPGVGGSAPLERRTRTPLSSVLRRSGAALITLILASGISLVAVSSPATAAAYPNIPGDPASTTFAVHVDGTSVFAGMSESYHYARFTSTGSAVITVTIPTVIASNTIYPRANPVAASASGPTLTFTAAPGPKSYIVKINALPNLVIVVDRPEVGPPSPTASNVVNVMTRVTDNTGGTDVTSQIHAAAENMRTTPGKNVLYFPNGTYLVDRLAFENFSNVTFYFASGALVKHTVAALPAGSYAMILIRGGTNVTLRGPGVLDHQAREFAAAAHPIKPPYFQLLRIEDSSNVTVQDLYLRNSRELQTFIYNSNGVAIERVKELSPGNMGGGLTKINQDAFHIRKGTNISITDCFTMGGDDSLVLSKEEPGDIANVTVDRLFAYNDGGLAGAGNAIRFGYGDADGDISDVAVRNSDFLNYGGVHVRLMNINAARKYANIIFDNNSFDGDAASNQNLRVEGEEVDVQIKLRNTTWFEDQTSSVSGQSATSPIDNLIVENWTMAGTLRTGLASAKITASNVGAVKWLSTNLATGGTASSSSSFSTTQTPDRAFDLDNRTNWQSANGTFANQWLAIDFGVATTFSAVNLTEYGNRTTGFRIEYWNGSAWSTALTGTTIGSDRTFIFAAVTASKARIYFTSGTGYQPIVYEFGVYA